MLGRAVCTVSLVSVFGTCKAQYSTSDSLKYRMLVWTDDADEVTMHLHVRLYLAGSRPVDIRN